MCVHGHCCCSHVKGGNEVRTDVGVLWSCLKMGNGEGIHEMYISVGESWGIVFVCFE